MPRYAVALLVALAPATVVAAQGNTKLDVDAAAASGGNGTHEAPYARIVDALDAGRAATERVTIVVAPGDYLAEPLPLQVDYAVTLRGSTVLVRDENGLATGDVLDAATIRGLVGANQAMIRISAPGVVVRGLRLEGSGTAAMRHGVAVDKSSDFKVHDLHISGLEVGVIASASTGKILDNFIGYPMSSAVVINGGNADHRADVQLARNRLRDYTTGAVAIFATADPFPPLEPFDVLDVTVEGNVASTTRPSPSGPSNPYGLRFNQVNSGSNAQEGSVLVAKVKDNVFSGNHRYPLIVSAGQITRTELHYHADVDIAFEGNQWVAGTGTTSRIFITFTNSRMGIAPLWNELATTAAYLENSRYALRHDGELAGCLPPYDGDSPDCRVDHPEVHPCDGRVLGNALEVNGQALPYGTFIDPDVCP
jgi:hypothetical protein